ncbi:transcriptional repressor LexA [Chloroflexota bacterium]
MKELSTRQRAMFDYIGGFISRRGYPPTIRDIQSACSVSSTSVVDYNLKVLEKNGYLRRHRDISRGIEIHHHNKVLDASLRVPLMGIIAAGSPIPVMNDDSWHATTEAETLTVTADVVGSTENVFALKVKGTSMIDALIADGDIVLMRPASQVENGAMAACWLKAEREVTLKKVYIEGERVRLQPANTQMQPIYTPVDNMDIQGRVVAVIRQISR